MTAPDTPRAAFRPACIYRSGCQNPQICLAQERCGGESRGRAEADRLPGAGEYHARLWQSGYIAGVQATERQLRAAEAERDALAGALVECRRVLTNPNPGICCTIWRGGAEPGLLADETLVDFIDAALATRTDHAKREGSL